jgi:N-acyl-D-aspartate/D-glutamate deacylase
MPAGEALLRLITEERGGADMLIFIACEEDIERVLSHPLCAIGSDSLAISPSGPTRHGYCHPRYYGTYPRFLVRYVREKKLVGLEEAVRKMTYLPAQRLRLNDRGLLKPGHFADIVIMDYDRLTDPATYESPQQFPQGIEYVIVNGAVAVENGMQTDSRTGRVL